MENSLNFTKEALTKIIPPKIKRNIYKDTNEKGLILIVSYGGSKIFYLKKWITDETYKIKIGAFPDLSITEARDKARELKSQIAKGINPAKEKINLSKEIIFKALFDKYINDYAKHKNKTWSEDVNRMNLHGSVLFNKKISTIQRDDIQKLFNKVTERGKGAANRFLALLSSVFNKAITWDLLEKNPVLGIQKHKSQSRERYIISEEIPIFFKILKEEPNYNMRDFFLMSLYTGARRSNVMAMRWENISFDNETWYIPGDVTKNGKSQLLPLYKKAIELLRDRKKYANTEWVFPSKTSKSGHLKEPKKAWKNILLKAGLTNLHIHDLRRTLGSWMAHSGESLPIIGKALNHQSQAATEIYARLSMDPVRKGINNALDNMEKIIEKSIQNNKNIQQ